MSIVGVWSLYIDVTRTRTHAIDIVLQHMQLQAQDADVEYRVFIALREAQAAS